MSLYFSKHSKVVLIFMVMVFTMCWVDAYGVGTTTDALSSFKSLKKGEVLIVSILNWIRSVSIGVAAIGAIVLLISTLFMERKFSGKTLMQFFGIVTTIALLASAGSFIMSYFT